MKKSLLRENSQQGFTLVELLIVVAIIGILAAVLTPQFLNSRKIAADRAAQAYVNQVATAQEVGYVVNGQYFSTLTALLSEKTLQPYPAHVEVTLSTFFTDDEVLGGGELQSEDGFLVCATSTSGTGKIYAYYPGVGLYEFADEMTKPTDVGARYPDVGQFTGAEIEGGVNALGIGFICGTMGVN